MTGSSYVPVFLLAFANDRDDRMGYLRNLPEEARRLYNILKEAQANSLCEVVIVQNATLDDIVQVFRDPKYHNRIALFHYGGHANGYQLLLETAEGKLAATYAGGLAAFLGQQRELEVIFLNGCSTEPQVQELLNGDISVVIATSQAIDDKVAVDFATYFYQALAIGSTIGTAFAEAVGVVKAHRGNGTRQLYYTGAQPEVADRWPWALHLRPGSEEMTQWNLPALVGNQLFGLPTLPKLDLPNTPYRYLDWYRREDAELFFGRGQDIRELYTRITAADSSPIILFYGQSGVGKSSLLAAGLLPRLEQSHTVVYLRRDHAKGLLGTLTSSPSPLCAAEQRLGWLGVEAQAGRPLLVVLDQIEEFRTRPNPDLPREMEQLLEALHEVFGDPAQRPEGKLLLSFRKEWLAEIEKQFVEAKLPHAKVFLERLDRRGIIDVVMGPTRVERLYQHYYLTVEPELAELIADDLLADQEAAVAPTLQILLRKLWERATAQSYGPPFFSRALYNQIREDGLGLGDFLDQQLDTLRQFEAAAVDSGLSLDLLIFHTTDQGTAGQRTASELHTAYRHQEATIPGLLYQCKALYLLTEPDQGGPDSEPMTRLAHDTLAPLVRSRYEISDAPGQRARRILESRVVHTNGGDGDRSLLEPLADADLALVEAGMAGMRVWDEAEQKLVDLSRKNREKLRQQSRLRQRTFVGLALAIIVALGLASVLRIRTLANETDLALAEASRKATEAFDLLEEDPVEAIYRNLAILPEPAPAAGRPYVPQAEFALYQALRSSLEQEYLDLSAPPLTADKVAFTDAQIAVGNDVLRLVPYDLSETEIITLTESLKNIKGVAWNDSKDALLVWNKETVQVWLQTGQSFEPSFTDDELAAEVMCAKWRPDSNQIAICRGTSLRFWSYQTGASQSLQPSSTNIEDARWSPDGNHLAIWNGPFALRLWNGQRMLRLETPLDIRIRDMAWSTDGQHFVTAFADGTAWVWPMENLRDVLKVRVSFNPGLHRVKFVDKKRFLTWVPGQGSLVQLWSVGSDIPIRAFGLASDNLQDVALSPDHSSLLTLLLSGVIRGWDLESGASRFSLQGHTGKILSTAWLDQSPYLATSSLDGTARVWNTETEEELVALHGHTGTTFETSIDLVVRWHKDGQHLFTYGEDSTIRLWSVFDEHRNPMCEGMDFCYGFSQVFSEASGKIRSASWLYTDTILATDESENALRLQLPSLEDEVLASQPDQGSTVEWSPDGEWVLRYNKGEDGTLWKFSTQVPITISGPISSAKWSDIGLLVSQGLGSARLIRLNSGIESELALPIRHEADISAVQAHGDLMATGDEKGAIWIWHYKADETPLTLDPIWQALQGIWEQSLKVDDTPFTLDPGEQSKDQTRIITKLQWSSTGTHLLSSDSSDNTDTVTLWDVEKRKMLKEWSDLSAAAFSPDGRYVALASQRTFHVFDLQTGDESTSVLGHSNVIQGIQWVEGRTWPNQDWFGPMVGGLLRWLQGQPWRPPSTRWLLLTWSNDGTVQLWQWGGIRNPAVAVARLSSTAGLATVALNADGSHLLTIDGDGVLRVWRMWLNAPTDLRRDAEKLVQQRTS
jgi:WD40 repeat protein